jgi:hypothetical protein
VELARKALVKERLFLYSSFYQTEYLEHNGIYWRQQGGVRRESADFI